jgi:hypothetical protein
MNINTLRKNYDKLNPKERFAALHAAALREDEQERKALLQSAPRKHWSLPDTHGLSDAFEWLSTWHVMNQLGYAAGLFWLMQMDDLGEEDVHIGEQTVNFGDAFSLLQRRILEGWEAWRAICKEYGIDPDAILEGLPHVETMEMTELIMRAASHASPIELTDLQATINGYRRAIETKRKQWE